MIMRYTPENIMSLKPKEVFVFGANERYIHGAGAAAYAVKKFGAIYGQGGLVGQSYGIPTKDYYIETLSLDKIAEHVDVFKQHVAQYPHLTYYVTAIGTGLAGLKVSDIAPMFRWAIDVPNVLLPESFHNAL